MTMTFAGISWHPGRFHLELCVILMGGKKPPNGKQNLYKWTFDTKHHIQLLHDASAGVTVS